MNSKTIRSLKLRLFPWILFSLLCVFQPSTSYSETLLEYHRDADQTQQHRVPKVDPSFTTASLQQSSEPATKPKVNLRRLAPQPTNLSTANQMKFHKRKPVSFGMPKMESLTTAATGLAIVVGLFLVCIWLLKGTRPKSNSPLPAEAVSLLGRVPLAQRNYAQLLQVGNKLVLVSVTPDGVAPITEVTEPSEVARLLGICLRSRKQSSTNEFHQVLEQLAQEPASGFLGNEASTAYARSS